MKTTKKRNMIGICVTVFAMFIATFPFSTPSYATGYSVDKAVNYAQKWACRYNDSQYKRIDDDCTNFVSQCIVAGGKSFVKPQKLNLSLIDWIKGYKYTTGATRWYNKKYSYKKGVLSKNIFCYSSSFTFVDSFYSFWKNQKCCSVYGSYNSCAKNSPLQNKLKKGDIIQMFDKSTGWHHSMIITSGIKGNWKYCAHTRNAKDKDLYKLQNKSRKFRIIRINY